MLKFIFFITLLFLFSCTSVRKQVYKFQDEQMGKQYEYMHKITNSPEKKELISFTYSTSNTSHYFESDASKHQEIVLTMTEGNRDFSYGISGYYYFGERKINSFIVDEFYSEKLSYNGFGLRFEASQIIGNENVSYRLFGFQGGLNKEQGEYFDWRREIDKKYDADLIVNYNRSQYTYSIYYVPEMQFHIDEDIDVGLFGGWGVYVNSNEKQYSDIYGFNLRVSGFGLSISNSYMNYNHIYFEGPFGEIYKKEVTLAKSQTRVNFSILF